MPNAQFKKTVESFTCEQCGTEVQGDGYTNHCPNCFYSKHVDVNPGDRAASCGGLMQPIAVEMRDGNWRIVQQCQQCGHQRPNKLQAADNQEAFISLQQQLADQASQG